MKSRLILYKQVPQWQVAVNRPGYVGFGGSAMIFAGVGLTSTIELFD